MGGFRTRGKMRKMVLETVSLADRWRWSVTFAQVSSARDEIRIGLQARSDTSLDELVCGSVYV